MQHDHPTAEIAPITRTRENLQRRSGSTSWTTNVRQPVCRPTVRVTVPRRRRA